MVVEREHSDLDQFIHGEMFVPSILIIATERVKEIIREANHLSIPELFAPFGGYYTPITCQYRVLDRPIRQQGLKVKFADQHRPSPSSSIPSSPPPAVQSIGRSIAFEKWFSTFNRSLNYCEYDCLDQPIATVLMVSSEDPNPMDCFEQLSHIANQPLPCQQGTCDPTSVRVKILVHDNRQPVEHLKAAESLSSQMMGIYAPNSVIFLPINSAISQTVDAEIHSLFSKQVPSVGMHAGAGLAWDDIDRLNRAVETIVIHNAIPWMERKLATLDTNITAKRKGFRNQLKNFLRPVPDPAAIARSAGATLSLQQVEWQCRLAGDLAFHMRHYELALSYYRNVCGDFKTDRLFGQAGGCYEMSGICALLLGNTDTHEVNRFFETAIDLFKEARMFDWSIRSALFQSFALRGRPDAAEKLIKVNGDIPDNGLRCAMVLDHAATLYGVAGMKRKEAFTRVLAGHMFNKVEGMKEWALDCYSSVLPMYTSTKVRWTYIVDHLLFTMAKLEFGLQNLDSAKSRLTELLQNVVSSDCPHPPGTADKHANYIKLLVYIGRSLTNGRFEIEIPKMKVEKTGSSGWTVNVSNPLLSPIEVSGMVVDGVQVEPFSLAPSESREVVELNEKPKFTEWTLYGVVRCCINVS
jgi:hypothetical protein